jgi:exonuclease V gamma subunit
LAERGGSSANLELPVPGRFVWRVLRDTLPGQPDSSDFERGPLA